MTNRQKYIDKLVDTECQRTGLKALMVTQDGEELSFTMAIHDSVNALDMAKMLASACAGVMFGLELSRADIADYVSVIGAYTHEILSGGMEEG